MAVQSGGRILSGRNADPFFCKTVIFLKIQSYRIDRGTQDGLILIGIQHSRHNGEGTVTDDLPVASGHHTQIVNQ